MTFLEELKTATGELLYLSETDAPLEPFLWKVEGTEEPETVLRRQANVDEATPIQTLSLSDFLKSQQYEYEGQPDVEKETVRRYKDLQTLLEARLTDVLAFRIGNDPEIPAYIVGRTPDGDLAGLSTRLVET